MSTFRYLAHAAAGLTVAVLAGCGGGGGGGGGGLGPVVYSGNTSPAVVTTTNASAITANVIGGDDSAGIIGGVSAESNNATQNQGSGPADLARRLGRNSRDIAVRVKRAVSNQQVASGVLVQVNDVFPCDGGGSIDITGTIDDMTGLGTLSATFVNCVFDGITINGPSTWSIDGFDVINLIPTDLTMSFARLMLRGTGLSVDAGGSLQFQEIGNTETITLILVEQNNNTGKMRQSANLVIVNVYDNISFPTSFNQTLTGQVFHSDHGFVNVATTQAFFFGTLAQLFPDSGQLLLTGAANSTIRVTALTAPPAALPATLASLELDLDGVGGVDNTARLKWTDLTGPIGADLGDSDADGMHNSWETVNGLDPTIDDAAGNKDGDAFTNLQEYLAGTAP